MSHARKTCSIGWPRPRSRASEKADSSSASWRPESRSLACHAGERGALRGLSGSSRVAKGSVLPGAPLAGGARKRVDGVGQLDVNEPGAADHGLPPCARQGTGNSTRPQVDIAEGLLGDWTLEANVSDRHPATWPKHSEDLAIDADLVRAEVDHTVGDDHIRPTVFDRQVLDQPLAEFDVVEMKLACHGPTSVELLGSHVDADHAALCADPERRKDTVHSGTRAQIDHPLIRLGYSPEKWVAHAG